MLGKLARAAVTTETGRKATGRAIKTAVGTKGGRKATGAGVRVAAKAARGTAKGAGKTALVGGKGSAKLAGRAAEAKGPSGYRLLRYGFFAAAGFAVGALVARAGSKDGAESSFTGGTGHDTPDPDSPAGRRGETWGSGTPLGTSGPGPAGGPPPPPPPHERPGPPPPPPHERAGPPPPPPHQKPEDPNRTGAERNYSDPSSGPLIGEHHSGSIADIPEQQEEVEQRIRSRVGDDPRTLGMQRLNVEVNDGIAEIRGAAPSETAKDAVGEIAADTEGVREVRNLITIE